MKNGARRRFRFDPASSVEEIINFAKAGEPSAIVLSPKLAEENPDLADKLKAAKLKLNVWTFDDVFEIQSETEEAKRSALLPDKILSNSAASLISQAARPERRKP